MTKREFETGSTDAPKRLGLIWWFIACAVFFLFYLATAQRTISWQDSGEYQFRVLEGDYSRTVPLARSHPLYIAAGQGLAWISEKHFPLLLNAFSGLGMAVALANIAAVGCLLTGKRWIGLVISAVLAVSHTVWWLSTIAEVYTWVVAGLSAELYFLIFLIRKPSWQSLMGLALVSGLGLCVHNFALLPLPVYIIVAIILIVYKKLPAWSIIPAAGAYILGAGLFIGMIVEAALRNSSIAWAIRDALTGHYADSVLNISAGSKNFRANMILTAMNFLNLLLPLAVLGIFKIRDRAGSALAVTLGTITAIEVIFFIRYPVPDQFTFILPSMVMIAVLACVGLDVLAGLSVRWRTVMIILMLISIVIQPVAYKAASEIAQRRIAKVRERQLPFRNEIAYWMQPWKQNEKSAAKFASLAIQEAGPAGVIFADNTSIYPLWLAQRLGLAETNTVYVSHGGEFFDRSDTQLLPALEAAALRKNLAGRPLFVVYPSSDCLPQVILNQASVEQTPKGSLYRVGLHESHSDKASNLK